MKNPHAVALGKLGGKAKSNAKVEAARLNGRKGGRPRIKGSLTCHFKRCRTVKQFGTDYCSKHQYIASQATS